MKKAKRALPAPVSQKKILDAPAIQRRYDISPVTRWRWERDGRLPRRDVYIGGVPFGWHESTIEAAERGPADATKARVSESTAQAS